MTHDELKDSLPAFALDALDPQERAEVAAHIATCAACTAELAVLDRVVSGVGLEAPPVTPPAGLKARVIARVEAERSRPSGTALPVPMKSTAPRPNFWNSGLAVAASLALAVGASLYAYALRTELVALRDSADVSSAQASRLRDELATLRRDRVTLQRIMDVLRSPDTLRVDLKGQGGSPGATGHAFWHRAAGLMFTADQLPPLPPGREYQLWTITGTTATSAGTFAPDASGGASIVAPVSAGAARPDAFGVTIEPVGGSPTPTLPIVLIGTAASR